MGESGGSRRRTPPSDGSPPLGRLTPGGEAHLSGRVVAWMRLGLEPSDVCVPLIRVALIQDLGHRLHGSVCRPPFLQLQWWIASRRSAFLSRSRSVIGSPLTRKTRRV